MTEIEGRVWLGTDSGLYRVEQGSAKIVPRGRKNSVTAVMAVDSSVWAGTENGILVVDDTDALRATIVPNESITVFLATDVAIWIGSSSGLFRMDRGIGALDYAIQPSKLIAEEVTTIKEIDNQVWVGTIDNIYRTDGYGSITQILDHRRHVADVVKAGSSIWVTSRDQLRYGRCIRIKHDLSVEEFQSLDDDFLEVFSVIEVDGEAWFATRRGGVFRLSDHGLESVKVGTPEEAVSVLAEFDGEVWVGTTGSIYRRPKGARSFERIGEIVIRATTPDRVSALNIQKLVDNTWIRTGFGAYRFDKDVQIYLRPSTHVILGTRVVLGRVVRISEARYDRNGHEPYGDLVKATFQVILESDERISDTLRSAPENFTSTERFERVLPIGFHDLYMVGRDSFGNTTQKIVLPSVLVLPGPVGMTILSGFSLLLMALLIVGLSPRVALCMSLLMQPAFRKSSLGIIQIALATSTVRRHLLRRYARRLRGSTTESAATDALDEQVLTTLRERRRVQIAGSSQKTSEYMNSLPQKLLLTKKLFGSALPIPLSLSLHAETIEEALAGKLGDIGGISDVELAKRILKQESFILVFANYDKLTKGQKKSVEAFISLHAASNYFVISTVKDQRVSNFPDPILL